jgi:hypothetical protein
LIPELLRNRFRVSGEVLNVGESQIPTLMQSGILGPLPQFVDVAADADLNVNG